jgi:hypothetical protein
MFHTEPKFLDLTHEWKAKLDRFAKEHADDPLGGVANHVLFEDEKVRIWEMKLEPGEYSALHHHALDYYLVIFSGDLVAGVSKPGSGVESFVGFRYSKYDTQFDTPSGFVSDQSKDRSAYELGLSYKPIPHVVLNLDWRNQFARSGDQPDEVRLGAGFVF